MKHNGCMGQLVPEKYLKNIPTFIDIANNLIANTKVLYTPFHC